MSERPLIAVLDYGVGNLRSAQKALERCGADAQLTADHGLIADAAGIVLPGVGHFGTCVEALAEHGLRDVATAVANEAAAGGRPFLGICVGMQLLYSGSDEAPGVAGLGVVESTVRLLPGGVKRPQMQWNVLDRCRPTPLLEHLDARPWMYFVHSYAAESGPEVVATCDYGASVVAAIERGRLWATQFHPEKSGVNGLTLLTNFVGQCRQFTLEH